MSLLPKFFKENLLFIESGEVFDLGENTFLISLEELTFRLSPDDILVMVTELEVVGGFCSESLGGGLLMARIVTLASVVGQNRFPILLSFTTGKLFVFFKLIFFGEEFDFSRFVIKASSFRR